MINLIYIILGVFLISKLIFIFFFEKKNYFFDTYFGVPGSGKTTFAAYLSKKRLKRKKNVYSNVAIKGAYEIEKSDVGIYDMSDSLIILDEASTEFLSRNYKANFNDKQVRFFKKHRHYRCDIATFSQYWNDIDIILRNLTTRLYLVKKSIFPGFIKRKEIGKRIGIDKDTKQIIDEYYFIFFLFGTKYIFCPPLWKMFKTHDAEILPKKEFKKYQ